MSYIGIDIGTSGCKASILDAAGTITATASRGYAFVSPRPGWAEMEPETVWRAVLEVLSELAPYAAGVRLLAVASIGESMVITDAAGSVLYNAINYVDSRCGDAVSLVEPVIDLRELHAVTGMPMNQMYSLNKLLWFRNNRPEVLDRAKRIFLFVDYFSYRLSGERLVDPSTASRTMLMDMRTLEWSREMTERFGIDRGLFSPIGRPGTRLAKLLPEVAGRTGLSRNIEVILGAHDQPCSTLGSGAFRAGDCLLGEGSSESLNLVIDGEHVTDSLLDNNITVEPFFEGKYFATTGQLTHGTSIRWFVEMFARELEAARTTPAESVYETADRLCAADSASIYFLPHMSGVDPNDAVNTAKGCFIGLDVTMDVWRMYRAVLEGLSFETRSRLDMLVSGGAPLGTVSAAGGASRSALFMQMKADVLERPIRILQNIEAGITGLGILCAVADGEYGGYEEAAKKFVGIKGEYQPVRNYSDRYHEYRKIDSCIRSLYRELNPA